jgi:dynactin complex subunit
MNNSSVLSSNDNMATIKNTDEIKAEAMEKANKIRKSSRNLLKYERSPA